MKYEVNLVSKSVVETSMTVLVEADSKSEVKELVKEGEFVDVLDSSELCEYDWKVIKFNSIEEYEE